MLVSLAAAAFNMSVALGCGALIGVERQMRQRKAGLRTNALVALGAAAFVVFSMTHEQDTSPTRIAAQVVSGIGFLGAGIIFRDGLNVHGLTTAATMWCAAAVGVLAGGGYWAHALVTTGLVVFVNLGLRPLVQWMKRKTGTDTGLIRHYDVTVICLPAREGDTRALMLRTLGVAGWQVSELTMKALDGGESVALTANVSAPGKTEHDLEQIMTRLAAEPGLKSVRWHGLDEA
ncbi:MgtC/SapB family protein [Gemmobacter serpentinus]|uniref:MgtC/SapB family protein n=1 Tax=Gemmobacter serpentinus TaxID=2652247 RepID=UPI00124CD764|nr:MgtC/SapB family protein [Gemmobacter serpentinus]